MTTETKSQIEIQEEILPEVLPEIKPAILAQASSYYSDTPGAYRQYAKNPWTDYPTDKMESLSLDDYRTLTRACKFFYKHDSLVSTVFNKIIDIGITNLVIPKANLSANEFRIINALKDELEEFAEVLALEYLISGLVVPEIEYLPATRDQVKSLGIKKYDSLILPVSMWVRDPCTIKIQVALDSSDPSYFVEIPESLIYFIMHNGMYQDGTKDPDTYAKLLANYADFVARVKAGEKYVKLENDLIFRHRPLSDSPYPIPYLSSVIEPLKHKRNLRRMDYSIASRVIGAIQLFRLGDKDFPITEDQQSQFDAIREQMYWRNSSNMDVERVFQLFANHTLQVDWVYPPFEALLSDAKYAEVNQDIMFGLGFPRILITGEASKTGTSDPEFASMSPIKTMENIRKRILKVINNIVDEVIEQNNLKGDTTVYFEKINLVKFSDFITALQKLYDSGNLSRESYQEIFGYNFEEELIKLEDNGKKLKAADIPEFAPQPFSPQPSQGQNKPPTDNKPAPDKKA